MNKKPMSIGVPNNKSVSLLPCRQNRMYETEDGKFIVIPFLKFYRIVNSKTGEQIDVEMLSQVYTQIASFYMFNSMKEVS